MTLPYRIESGRLILFIRLTPKGGRDALEGIETVADGKSRVKARVSAVPEDDRANASLIALIAKKAGVAKSAVSLVSGQTSRLKQVAVEGDPLQIIDRLGL